MLSAAPLAAGRYVAADGALSHLWVLIALPLLGSAILLLGGRRTDKWGPNLACAMTGAAFVYGLISFFALKGKTDRGVDLHLFSWIPVNGFHVDAGLLFDPLAATFVLLITGVGFLIHVYSLGYMAHDPRKRVFFAYLNLFVAAMLLLVLGDSFLALYVGWEGVGLASYLLIAFWFYKPDAATAAKKAFIANRVGDVGLSLAIMVMFATLGTTSFDGVFSNADKLSAGSATAIGLLLLLGACGKSGQFPLQTWLPDAMEGPTPVSALIHAATMVTAGVYLIARATPVFDHTDTARLVVSIIGAVTLVIGCIIGCAYDDIKKVLAYSTVSQIGYMFLAVGIPGAGAIAILHLLTHGFFKACMFLSAGSVMHGMNDQVDMRRYGALRTVMPVTFGCFLMGYLAIIGMPPFAGFFSKDKIIEAAYDEGGMRGWTLGTVALLGAAVTAYYMTRLMAMTFFGEKRWTDDVHPHESPKVMTVPMIVLAVGSVVSGFLLTLGGGLQHWLEPSVGKSTEVGVHTISPVVLTLLTLLVVIGGAAAAFVQFGRRAVPTTPPVAVTPMTVAARKNLYFDAINESVLMRPGQYLTRALVFLDNRGIDGAVNGLAAGIGGGSGRLRRVQTGFVRSYALSMFGGAALVVAALLAVRLGT
ncbi:MAG: NADH-quinone oxidoreductase subunit [Actinomycetota bacterium]|jgi:NADH-quinone oxidoreductase subunit L|nr:NADH-quinone oxidoreductase subunit [Actinomycetota bacterium]